MIIAGAGLSGLIAGHIIKDAVVLEQNPRGQMHNAVLRFRSDVVSKATGIPFKKVTVRKGIYMGRQFYKPNIRICNMYSQKAVAGKIGDRSIWNQDPVERWIAPSDFYDRMIGNLGNRIRFEEPVNLRECDGLISTVPMPTLLDALAIDRSEIAFEHAPIYTMRVKIANAEAYQTVYFPSHFHGMYRASLTGDNLILEFVSSLHKEEIWIAELTKAFHLDPETVAKIKDGLIQAEFGGVVDTQQYGKIWPLAPGVRRSLLLYLTAKFGVYSIGRFATWRNILLDDLVQDAHRVLDMMQADEYHLKLERGHYASNTD